MQRTLRKNKTYSYPITNVGLDDDVAIVFKRIAKERRMPMCRLASDILRRWCDREARKEAHEHKS
jgi:hypothetical protein